MPDLKDIILGNIAVERGLVPRESLAELQRQQRDTGLPLGQVMLRAGVVNGPRLIELIYRPRGRSAAKRGAPDLLRSRGRDRTAGKDDKETRELSQRAAPARQPPRSKRCGWIMGGLVHCAHRVSRSAELRLAEMRGLAAAELFTPARMLRRLSIASVRLRLAGASSNPRFFKGPWLSLVSFSEAESRSRPQMVANIYRTGPAGLNQNR